MYRYALFTYNYASDFGGGETIRALSNDLEALQHSIPTKSLLRHGAGANPELSPH